MVKREQGHGRLQTRHARGEIGGDGADGHVHVDGRVAGDELGPPPAARSSRRPRMPSGEVVAPAARIEYEPAKPAARCTAGTPTGADRCGPPGQLPDHPGAAAIRPVLRPDLTIEYPTRSGRQLTPPGDRREPHRPARLHPAPRTRRPATRPRRRRPAAHRPRVEGDALSRVLPRRQRRRPGRMHQTGWTALVADLIPDPPGQSHRMIFHDDPIGEEPTSTTARTRKGVPDDQRPPPWNLTGTRCPRGRRAQDRPPRRRPGREDPPRPVFVMTPRPYTAQCSPPSCGQRRGTCGRRRSPLVGPMSGLTLPRIIRP